MTEKSLAEILDQAYEALSIGSLGRARDLLAEAQQEEQGNRDVVLLEVDILLDEAQDDEDLEAAFEVLEAALDADPEDPILKATMAAHLVEYTGDFETAKELLEPVADGMGAYEIDTKSRDFFVEVLVLLSECYAECRKPMLALNTAQRAVQLTADSVCLHCLAQAHFDLCHIDEARKATEEAIKADPDNPDAHWMLGRVETFQGNDEAAGAAFEKARSLDPDSFYSPPQVDEDALVALVEQGIEELPEKIKSSLENVAITVEDLPRLNRLTQDDPPLSPAIVGLFEGTPKTERGQADVVLPTQITFFRKNLQIDARDLEELQEMAVMTLLHEVGHFLGFDEEDLQALGLS